MNKKVFFWLMLLPFFASSLTLEPHICRVKAEATIKAVVLDSWGADYPEYTIYPLLNEEWSKYGDIPIIIDYTTLNKESITYNDIAQTNADVLIISHAYPRLEHEFTDAEIDAIKKYVEEGHGIIGTYGTLVPNNNHKLAELFGMNQSIDYIFTRWGGVSTGIFNILDTTHPLFVSIPNPFSLPTAKETIYVPSNDWTVEGVTDGTIGALATNNKSVIIIRTSTYKSIYFTNEMEEKTLGMPETSIQIFYNAIIWAGKPIEAPIEAFIDVKPKFVSLMYRGKYINAYVELPENYNIANINVTTIVLNGSVSIAPSAPITIGDYNENGISDLMVKFDRTEVADYILDNVNLTKLFEERSITITLTITGYFYDGTQFQGIDTIQITLPTPRGLYKIFLI